MSAPTLPRRQPTVLVVADYFVPGFRGGGVITAVANALEQLQTSFVFNVLTSDRDLDASEPYPNVVAAAWNDTRYGKVFYATPAQRGPLSLREIVRQVPFDLLYLNSFFSPFSFQLLLLRRLGLLKRTPVVLAPRGELAPSALSHRRFKKVVYEKVVRLGFLDGVTWQASSDHEAKDIVAFFEQRHGRTVQCVMTGEVPAPFVARSEESRRAKVAGKLRAVFLGRVHRIKNLDLAIKLVASAAGDIDLTVVGPMEDEEYWKECEALIDTLPPGKTVHWVGAMPKDAVGAMLTESDLMLLPTSGENFGHAILEALAAGCPVLTSDQTPWRNLAARGVGWDIPLDDFASARAALNDVTAMGSEAHDAMRARAKAFAQTVVPDAIRLHEELFRLALT